MKSADLQKLSKQMRDSASSMSPAQARCLVDDYYAMQDNRKRAGQQIEASESDQHQVLEWLSESASFIEYQIKCALDSFAGAHPMGIWSMNQKGIGPVLAAGLIVHIDISKATTVGHIWRFAGLDPTSKWERGKKRPHNAALKQICFHVGECLIRSNNTQYRAVYDKRREYEELKNSLGDYSDQAAAVLKNNPHHKQAEIYKQGKLPDGQLHARSKRYMVKLFLSHWWEQAYRQHFGKEPPLPYPIAQLSH